MGFRSGQKSWLGYLKLGAGGPNTLLPLLVIEWVLLNSHPCHVFLDREGELGAWTPAASCLGRACPLSIRTISG